MFICFAKIESPHPSPSRRMLQTANRMRSVNNGRARHLLTDTQKNKAAADRNAATALYDSTTKDLPDDADTELFVSVMADQFKNHQELLSLLFDASTKSMQMHRDARLNYEYYTKIMSKIIKTNNATSSSSYTPSPVTLVAHQPKIIVGDIRKLGRAKSKKEKPESLSKKSRVRDNRTALQKLETLLADINEDMTSMTSEVDARIDDSLESLDSNVAEEDRQLVLKDLHDCQMKWEHITKSPEYKAMVLQAKQVEKKLKEKSAKKNEETQNMRIAFGMPDATVAELHEVDRKQKENIANQGEASPLSKIEIQSLTSGDEVSKVAGKRRAGRGKQRPSKKKLDRIAKKRDRKFAKAVALRELSDSAGLLDFLRRNWSHQISEWSYRYVSIYSPANRAMAVRAVRMAKKEHRSMLRKHKAQRMLKQRRAIFPAHDPSDPGAFSRVDYSKCKGKCKGKCIQLQASSRLLLTEESTRRTRNKKDRQIRRHKERVAEWIMLSERFERRTREKHSRRMRRMERKVVTLFRDLLKKTEGVCNC